MVPLSARDEYEGGGTYVEPLGQAFALDQGCALLHPSAVRHAGHRITSGHRWVLVLFIIAEEMRYGEHVRHFKARALRCHDEGDEEGDRLYMTLARAMCDDAGTTSEKSAPTFQVIYKYIYIRGFSNVCSLLVLHCGETCTLTSGQCSRP